MSDGWISVKERLPERVGKFWCEIIPRPAEECPLNTSGEPILPLPFPPYCGIVSTFVNSKGEIAFNNGGLSKVRHWRELPAPPKE